jgi:hypothetical protein
MKAEITKQVAINKTTHFSGSGEVYDLLTVFRDGSGEMTTELLSSEVPSRYGAVNSETYEVSPERMNRSYAEHL